jgi:hypothetical protein
MKSDTGMAIYVIPHGKWRFVYIYASSAAQAREIARKRGII